MAESNVSFDPEIHHRLGIAREKGMFKIRSFGGPGPIPATLDGLFTTVNDARRALETYKAPAAPPPPPKRPVIKYKTRGMPTGGRKLSLEERMKDRYILDVTRSKKRNALGEFVKKEVNSGQS